ncbi:sulfite exporter TauE/SafE family protein [Anaeromyxobacter sp. PSR-1]|uniref:sulfite exporter TauE/SafE family protein n=1 Tax=Anaeromyxobacter sp. PSR-1 TaxID=1300915 RepID=UPI0005E0562A|nr:sulfite exporter TauE/SafE family protein [Anaeromyxobacter sp. PSR-1]GAO01481.1 sulfite exporter TauE/SafE [Anaeromyxobacter sp. PSR-1]
MILLLAGGVTFTFTVVLTIAGVGAAFILIPVFIALGIEVHAAMATALLLNAVALAVASVRNARRGFIDYRTGLPILLVAAVLSPLGAWASQGLDRRTLLSLFVLFLLFAAVMMLRPLTRSRADRPSTGRGALFGSAVGAAAGFVGGLLGVGGGNIIAPVLVTAGVEPRRASATTSFAVVFSSLAGFLAHASLSAMDPAIVGATAACSVAGALLGSYLMTDRLRGPQVRTVLGAVLLVVAVKIGWGLLP